MSVLVFCQYFLFNDAATTEIYTLSLHDALPISSSSSSGSSTSAGSHGISSTGGTASRTRTRSATARRRHNHSPPADRKSTRLNSSHANISYAVFCLKKKNKRKIVSV